MNYEDFMKEISILKSSTVKTVNWKSVAKSIGSTLNTVLKYVNSSERPAKPDLELCDRILKSAKSQFMTDYNQRTMIKQSLGLVS